MFYVPSRDDDYDNMMSTQNKTNATTKWKHWFVKKKTKMKKKSGFKPYFKRMKFNGMVVSPQMAFKRTRTTPSIIVMVCSRKNIYYGHYYMHNKSC